MIVDYIHHDAVTHEENITENQWVVDPLHGTRQSSRQSARDTEGQDNTTHGHERNGSRKCGSRFSQTEVNAFLP